MEVLDAVISDATTLKGLARRLVNDNLLSSDEAFDAVLQANKLQVSLVAYLSQHNIIPGIVLAHAATKEFGIPLLDLEQFDVKFIPSKLLKSEWLKRHHVLPLYQQRQRIYVAISDPASLPVLDEMRFATGKNIEAILVDHEKLADLISQLSQGDSTGITSELDSMSNDLLNLVDQDIEDPVDTGDIDDTPIVRFVNQTIMDAIDKGASDLHFEPFDDFYRVRFRIDGMLYEVASPPVAMAPRIASRLKIMSKLNIAERRLPQDGKMKIRLSKDKTVDMRINTCPAVYGEKIVIRILDASNLNFDIEALGFEPQQQEAFLSALRKPHGMILVTGPTGSGKTVTLYSGLNLLNGTEKNICTAEDPAEIYLPGVNQVNVNASIGLDFSSVLRAFLRQDPDIIMLGEIRDFETAEIAIKAAQTGHLVLSTLHTNSAEQTIDRLSHMGIAPFNLASTIKLIVSQRLMRMLCSHCKKAKKYPEKVLKDMGFSSSDLWAFTDLKVDLYTAVGCKKCTDGYKGRVGVYQVLPMSDSISELVLHGANEIQLAKQSKKEGIINLQQAAIHKVISGVTSLEEMARVVHNV